MRSAPAIFALLIAATAQAQLMPAAKERELRALFPRVDDKALTEAMADPRLLIYTREEIPPAYQSGGRFVSVARDQSDGNFRFPWADPVGMQRVENGETFKFISLPRQPSGQPWPVVYYNGKLDSQRDQSANSTRWTFPVGTRVGEMLVQVAPDGKRYPFLIRLLTREIDDWDGEQFAPYPTAASLADGIAELRPNWQSDQKLSNAVASLTTGRIQGAGIENDRNAVRLISLRDGIYNLPPLDAPTVAELLSCATFEPLLGTFFKHDGDLRCVMPSNEKGSFNVVPPNFRGTFAGNTRESCKRCHATFGQAQVRFDQTWTGHLRGDDRIASFRPGTTDQQGRFVPRKELLNSGLIAPFDPSVHPSSIYSPLSN